MKEIVTLQFGNLANYVSTQYWNIQDGYNLESDNQNFEIYDTNVLFQEGLSQNNSKNFGNLKSTSSDLYSEKQQNKDDYQYFENDVAKDIQESNTIVYESTKPTKNRFLESFNPKFLATSEINYFSDINMVYYHPNSIHEVSGLVEGGSGTGQMSTFYQGQQVYDTMNKDMCFVDEDFRKLLEKCDDLQGIQIISDAYGGFSGFRNNFMEDIRSELPKKTLLVYSVSNLPTMNWKGMDTSDSAIGFASCLDLQASFIPLYLPSQHNISRNNVISELNMSYLYHSSAIQSVFLDSLTVPLMTHGINLDDIIKKVSVFNNENFLVPKINMQLEGSNDLENFGDSDQEFKYFDYVKKLSSSKNEKGIRKINDDGWISARGKTFSKNADAFSSIW
ncbi:hypothetical protein BB558_002624 [Smittium angustum]|uniref:Tubulin/FtsZ GTPase domain-containing protein n=1 Tax=Smittium angustum TaxID=133377 RepID=A0A2U1J8J8_SMIAN|nr:hypothetical protein BB558_002624 [Smittium angustum]